MLALAFACSHFAYVANVPLADEVLLATFDNSTTARKWSKTDDPVMGGRSKSTFYTQGDTGIFDGTCAIVPQLKAPGFCKIQTGSFFSKPYANISSFADGALYLTVRSSSASFKGFKVAVENKHARCPRPGFPGTPSWKAPFDVPAGDGFVTVKVPFNTFSCDWSGYTGGCDTKDPTGQQHVCCTAATPEVCPTPSILGEITGLEVWAEGAEGDFHLELKSIGAGPL